MAGIFPSTGVTPANTQNGVTGITTTGCGSLFYRNNCNPRFDPVATNALISEILNASNAFGKAYDCSKLDNLKTALTAARDLCDLAVKSPDNDDFLAGCFDGASGLTSISALKALFALCTLPTTTAPDNDDFLGGCFDGVDGKVSISALRDLIIGQVPQPEAGILSGWDQGGTFHSDTENGSVDLTGRNAFFARPGSGESGTGIFYSTWDVGGQDLDFYITIGESRISLEPKIGRYLFVRGANGTDWYLVRASGEWVQCGSLSADGNIMSYSAEKENDTGTLLLTSATKRVAIA
jgi:hypothetical protein